MNNELTGMKTFTQENYLGIPAFCLAIASIVWSFLPLFCWWLFIAAIVMSIVCVVKKPCVLGWASLGLCMVDFVILILMLVPVVTALSEVTK